MPIYTFRCETCDETFDKMTSIDRRDEQVCDKCESPLKRGLDRPALVYSPTANGGYS